MMLKYKDPVTKEFKNIYMGSAESIPVGTVLEYEGDVIPQGFELVEEESNSEHEHSIITLNLAAKPSFTNQTWFQIPFDNYIQLGDQLTFTQDGGVKIGPGVSHIKVSGIGNPQSSTGGLAYMRICKNSSGNILTWSMNNIAANWASVSVVIPTKMVKVDENDIIYMYIYTEGTGSIGPGNGADCSLTVEVIR